MKWDRGAFDRVVLAFRTKELVQHWSRTGRASQRGVRQGLGLAGEREDIISGKGNGLIMLFQRHEALAGRIGTVYAECAAQRCITQ